MTRAFLRAGVALAAIATASVASAQQVKTTVSDGGGRLSISYTVKVSGAVGQHVRIEVPRHGVMTGANLVETNGCKNVTPVTLEGKTFMWSCELDRESATVELRVSGPESELTIDSRAEVTLFVAGKKASVPNVQVLKPTAENSLVQVVFGGGIAGLQDDKVDFALKNDLLVIENDSPKRPTLLAGALFRVLDIKRHQLSAHTSFQFAQGGAALDGVALGVGVELSEVAHVTAGVSLRKGRELSRGFRRAVADVVKTEGFSRYAAFDPQGKDDGYLDGLPLKVGEKRFYDGDPIVDSYNWSIYLGVVVPVRIGELFGAKPAAKDGGK